MDEPIAGRRAIMKLFLFLSTAAFGLVGALSGFVALLLTYDLVKAAVVEPRSFEYFEARLRHHTDRLVANPEGTWTIIKYPHPVFMMLTSWAIVVIIFVASVYVLRRNIRVWSAR